MAEKKKEEAATGGLVEGMIELGDFGVVDNSDRDRTEVRFSDEKANSFGVLRRKNLKGAFEVGASYRLYAQKVAEAPPEPTAIVEVPESKLDKLPAGSEIVTDAK